MRLFALSIYSACELSLVLGALVFIRNAIFRRDREYEARFPWWVRLSLYLLVLVIPLAGVSSQDLSLNASVWTNFLLGTVALAIPPLGLLGSLWLVAFRRTRERVKLARGLFLVSLVPIVFLIGMSVDPNTHVIYGHRYSDPLVKESEAGARIFISMGGPQAHANSKPPWN